MSFLKRINIYAELFRQFGIRYAVFRLWYELSKKLGVLKTKFPQKHLDNELPTLEMWKRDYSDTFFIPERAKLTQFEGNPSDDLKIAADNILKGRILFFSQEWKDIGFSNEWNVHPISGYEYPKVHWTQLPIYDSGIGDIKYVWEKSKFSYLLYLIRADHHFSTDQSEFVFKEIISWINANAPNTGPQYICSQEISIRLLNWSFALFFYQRSSHLTQSVFDTIMRSIEVQYEHIYQNINFSRIAVRNNHAVTETLALYLIGTYYPFLKNATHHKAAGKKWFEAEIDFQLFKDGSDSQYSFNYHRVKIQLLTWAIATAAVNKDKFADIVYNRARTSIKFLYNMMGNKTYGLLPNFGPNDGSIYFKLNDCDFRNYLPQLNALAKILEYKLPVPEADIAVSEDSFWFTQKLSSKTESVLDLKKGIETFPAGGHFLIREEEFMSYLKTGKFTFRAAQNDALHLDLWFKGYNFLRDAGSYSYNVDEATMMEFNGVTGHNSVSLNGGNHMVKGPRFTWLYKPIAIGSSFQESDEGYTFEAIMEVSYPKKHTITRKVIKLRDVGIWEVRDSFNGDFGEDDLLVQFWNLAPELPFKVEIFTYTPTVFSRSDSWSSVYYGQKEKGEKMIFTSKQQDITTRIQIHE